jgi:hypothetical protein
VTSSLTAISGIVTFGMFGRGFCETALAEKRASRHTVG